jgi:hydroxymethylbilane synthase
VAILKMGTRGSPLALAQSGQAARALEKLNPGLTVETVVIKTSGDLFGAPSPEVAKTLPQGAKGLWVKEIEEALLDGRIDFAVHSGKDLPALLAGGLSVAAYPEREDPRDAFVARPGLSWERMREEPPGRYKVGTSSLRRKMMLSAHLPVEVVPLRGNVDTRLRKLADGEFDAMVIAVAGLKRLGRGSVAHEPLDPFLMIPAPAQGALALEIRADRRDVASVVGTLDHAVTRRCVELERAFLAQVGGGCGAPVGAYATEGADGRIAMSVFYAREGEAHGQSVHGSCPPDAALIESFVPGLVAKATAR